MIDIQARLTQHQKVIRSLEDRVEMIQAFADLLSDSLGRGGKVLLMGNGGSAADAQHLAGEIVGRFLKERPGWAAIALSTDTSVMTAIANDYGYEQVFARQVEGLCKPEDVVVGISTSGNSKNVLCALRKASELGATTVAMTGGDGGQLASLADLSVNVPSSFTPNVQEAHILIGHIVCELVEQQLTC